MEWIQVCQRYLQVLSAERNDSLVKLEDEVSSLTEVNAKLEQRIEELQRELEHERRSQSRVISFPLILQSICSEPEFSIGQ